MAKPPGGRGVDPRWAAAEAAFKPKAPERVKEAAALPNVRQLVSLRIDAEILEHFQADGPGWQERINDALRKVVEAAR